MVNTASKISGKPQMSLEKESITDEYFCPFVSNFELLPSGSVCWDKNSFVPRAIKILYS